MSEKKVAIGLCTYKRPKQLAGCLQSLEEMQRPLHVSLCVIVADNDPAGSARGIVTAFKNAVDFRVYYAVEEKPGIPCARNCILREAQTLGITDLAFIDDDEYVAPNWLVSLWDSYISAGADVMAGHVITEYPPETPLWITQGRFFQNPRKTIDEPLNSAATNNVIFDFQKLVVTWGLFFDEHFGLRGGSDSDFFHRAAKRGAVIRWTEDAVVYELLAKGRMNLSYLLKNRFRKSNLKLGYADLSRSQKTELFFGLLKKIIIGIIVVPFSCFRGFGALAAALNRLVAAVANMLALTGFRIGWNEYSDCAQKNEKK